MLQLIFRKWWVVLIQGILLILLSLYIFNNPVAVLAGISLWVGILVLAGGLVGIIAWLVADKAEKEKIEKLNTADSLVFQTEKQLKEYGDKIPADKKTAIEAAVTKLKEAHKAQDLAAIELASTELNNAWTAASQDIYNAQQQQGPGAQQPGADAGAGQQQSGNGNAENVQDVPFEEVK